MIINESAVQSALEAKAEVVPMPVSTLRHPVEGDETIARYEIVGWALVRHTKFNDIVVASEVGHDACRLLTCFAEERGINIRR